MTAAGQPALHIDRPRGPVRAVAVVLHGGRATSTAPVRPRQLAVLRMVPFAAQLRRCGTVHGLAVARCRFVVRGWNGEQQSPVADVRWALDQLADRFAGAPVVLVGHSMGARAALYAADHRAVRAVVGLAPWIEADDPVASVAGRRVLLAHGDRDHVTSPKASARFAAAAQGVARSATFVTVAGEAHAMMRRAPVWHRLAAQYATGAALGVTFDGTDNDPVTNVVAQALAGAPTLTL